MKFLSLSLWLVFFLFSCSEEKHEARFVNYTKELDSVTVVYGKPTKGEYIIDLSLVFNKNPWDSIAFILPYLPEKYLLKSDFCNLKSVRDTMQYVIETDWSCGLLFFKDNCIHSYSVIGGNPSFAEIIGKDRPAIPMLTRSNSKVKIINTPNTNGEQSFTLVPLNYPAVEAEPNERMKMIPIDSLKL
ncbi:hypothetical protein [Ohtaekwangia koreensis]|uniref:Lipoprotein n=1 Tax=Ohtaekwangia koreensis TaxID=688867 RepID=A0A1T5MAX1_9BACT|nr:hypothetical protein [Ohtaekwangia koreensis]SKC85019.1 hypothetical protein SAMN05660236_4790 [Ohtaekwangia koreensis]